MNKNENSITYFGSISLRTGDDGSGSALYQNTLNLTEFVDHFETRKLLCLLMSHFFSNVSLPEYAMLELSIICIDEEAEASYPVLVLAGNSDTIQWMLDQEIDILDCGDKHLVEEMESSKKKASTPKGGKKRERAAASRPIGFEYANRN